MGGPLQAPSEASRPGAVAVEMCNERGRAQFIADTSAGRCPNAPAHPGGASARVVVTQKNAARLVLFGGEQQTACRGEAQGLLGVRNHTHHRGVRQRERLFTGPQGIGLCVRAHQQQAIERNAMLRQSLCMWDAMFGEALFGRCPDKKALC